MRFFCQTCPYLYQIETRIEKHVQLQRKQVDDVLGGDEAWDNVDQTEGVCPILYSDHKILNALQFDAHIASTTTLTLCRFKFDQLMSLRLLFTNAFNAKSNGTINASFLMRNL